MKNTLKNQNARNNHARRLHSRRVMHSSRKVEWSTPDWLFEALDKLFKFSLDPCSTEDNAKCKLHYTADDDGLLFSWAGHTVWLNPPYGPTIGEWMENAVSEAQNAGTTVVCLIPSRTGAAWFQKSVLNAPKKLIFFFRGRLCFGNGKNPAAFDSVLVVYPGKGVKTPTVEEIRASICPEVNR
ncbi:MAG: DNA N-6-adenine-methyltransferase [Terrimicrobiaceae bacterium]